MKNDALKKYIPFIFLVLILLFLIHYTPHPQISDPSSKITKPGDFVIHAEEQIPPYEEISSMIVEDGSVFLFYDPYGIVNVYSTEGDFQYGIQVYTIANSYGDFAYKDSNLYILSRGNQIYKFAETELLTVIDSALEPERFRRYEALYLSAEKNTVYHGEQYYLLKDVNKVTKESATGEFITVIDLEPTFRIGW